MCALDTVGGVVCWGFDLGGTPPLDDGYSLTSRAKISSVRCRQAIAFHCVLGQQGGCAKYQ